MIEILNVRVIAGGYLVNGYIPTYPNEDLYNEVLLWIEKGNTPEPEFSAEELLAREQSEFRAERDGLLSSTDLHMLVDKYNLLSTTQQAEISAYRQALRDSTIEWVLPTAPTWL